MESTNRAAQIINAPVADVNGGDVNRNIAAVDCNRVDVGVTAATASLDDRETSSSVAGETTNASPAEMNAPGAGVNARRRVYLSVLLLQFVTGGFELKNVR